MLPLNHHFLGLLHVNDNRIEEVYYPFRKFAATITTTVTFNSAPYYLQDFDIYEQNLNPWQNFYIHNVKYTTKGIAKREVYLSI